MPSRGLIDFVDEFLALLQQGVGTAEENERTLGRLLDSLALARHDLQYVFDNADHPEPPEWPYQARRSVVCERFPGYGYYNVASPVSVELGKPGIVVGDAVDDLADIAGDLAEVAWYWRNTSEASALWHFENSFQQHWGQHLRALQL